MKKIIINILILLLLASCTRATTQTPTGESIPSTSPATQIPGLENCRPAPYSIPTLPATIPGYAELDESIGLHITGAYEIIDIQSYRLKISGMVNNPMELTYDQIRCLPTVTASPMLICPGYFEDMADWKGVPLKVVLDLAGVQAEASKVLLVSADGYQVELTLAEALQEENFLAYEVNGQTLPILHGFPLRAVIPELIGGKWVKWLVEIQVK